MQNYESIYKDLMIGKERNTFLELSALEWFWRFKFKISKIKYQDTKDMELIARIVAPPGYLFSGTKTSLKDILARRRYATIQINGTMASSINTFGVYFSILPALPSIPPSSLKDECLLIKEEYNSSCDSGEGLEWTHDRIAELNHPQLSEPLAFLEISGKLSTATSVENACQSIVDRLNAKSSIVGNAEFLLALAGTPIPLLDCQLPQGQSKEIFNQYGLVALPNSVGSVDELYLHTVGTFNRFYEVLQEKGGRKHFKEIMQRDNNRFDFRIDLEDDNTVWQDVEMNSKWLPLVGEILGDFMRVKCGCVLSLPGTGEQYWHSDGVHAGQSASFDSSEAESSNSICVFVPLIDLSAETGYTEFWAGSHRYSKLLSKKGEQALPGGTLGIISKGDCLLYDYRTVHRGMPNTSTMPRPVVYYLYAKKSSCDVEDQNFTNESLFAVK